jgi:redox-sensitive bicupin YhaK (pirin superfamily)
MRPRSVAAAVSLPEHRMGPGFVTRSLRGFPDRPLDPFLSVDHFWMSQPTFPPHPHAGFSAVTWMFEDSPGAFVNRDSLGDRSRIGPGALHWTQAARGMMHEEVPERPGVGCHGLQIFVNLRSDHKDAPPAAFHADVLPLATGPGWRARVLAGRVGDVVSPLGSLLTPVSLLDVVVDPGASFVLPVAPEDAMFALAIDGQGRAGATGTPLPAHAAVAFADDGDAVTIRADTTLHVVIGGGRPLREAVVAGGPFVMNRREDLDAAAERYRRGAMGALAPTRWP